MRPSADVLVAAAEAALRVALEVGEHDEGAVVGQVAAHGHAVEPLAATYGEGCGVLLVEDVDGAERPAVHLQRTAVLLGGVAVALIVRVGLDDAGVGQVFLKEGLDPVAGNDVGAVLLAGVQLHAGASPDVSADLLVGRDESLGREATGEVDYGLVARAGVVGDVKVAVGARADGGRGVDFLCHGVGSDEKAAREDGLDGVDEYRSFHVVCD